MAADTLHAVRSNQNLRLLSRLAFGGFAASGFLLVVGVVASGIASPGLGGFLLVLSGMAFTVGLVSQIAVITVRAIAEIQPQQDVSSAHESDE
jgi:hypothetical protein